MIKGGAWSRLLFWGLLATSPLLQRCGGTSRQYPDGGAGSTGSAGTTADIGSGGATAGAPSGGDSGEAGAPIVVGAQLTATPPSGDFQGAIGIKVPASTFTVTNTGSEATGSVSVALAGTGFTLSADQCTGKALDPGSSCTVGVGFFSAVAVPRVAGSLVASATPGGETTVALTGSALPAAHLTLAPDTGSSAAFGDVLVGSHTEQHFIVTNTGKQTASTLVVDLPGSSFSLEAGGAGSCVPLVTALAGGASCTITVSFAPAAHGPFTSSLSAYASIGGTAAPLSLSGNGVVPPTITSDVASKDFGTAEVGVATAPVTLTFDNDGDLATGALTLSASSELTLGTGCASIAAHQSCMVQVSFKAAGAGPRVGMLTLTGASGGMFTFNANAEGRYRLSVSRPGAVAGRVTSSPAGIDCSAAGAATCSALFANGPVQLSARTTNGSNAFFSGWSGGGCTGPANDCTVNFGAAATVVASFSPQTNNLIFATHDSFAATLGSAAAYDTKCNLAATAAGLNNVAGNAYIAYVSSPTSLATSRLGSARGWVRLDGRPFADTLASILTGEQIFNAIAFDETGRPASDVSPLTGTTGDGKAGDSCSGWTSTAGDFVSGNFHGGPYVWGGVLASGDLPCTASTSLICMGNTKTAAAPAQVTAGRKLWLTTTNFVIGGGTTPDQKCQAERPVGVTTAIAFISYSNKVASSLLVPNQNYVRPDGTWVGTGAEIGSSANLESGIWQSAAGTYELTGAWTGSPTANVAGDMTCGDWTSTTGTGSVGATASSQNFFWWANSNYPCNRAGVRLYCVQTAP